MIGTIPRRDRAKGFLSPHDKKLLYGGLDFQTDASPQKRYRMRNRIRSGIVDFSLLNLSLPNKERKSVFKPKGDTIEDTEFFMGVINMMAFVYRGCRDHDELDFRNLLRSAVSDTEEELHSGMVDVAVDFDVTVTEQATVRGAREKFETGEPLTREEIGLLVEQGGVEGEDLEKLAAHARENPAAVPVRVPPTPTFPNAPMYGEGETKIRDDPAGSGMVQDLSEDGKGALDVRKLNALRESFRSEGGSPEELDNFTIENMKKLARLAEIAAADTDTTIAELIKELDGKE